MPVHRDSDASELLKLAANRGWISTIDGQRLETEARNAGVSPEQWAVDAGFLLPVQLDILAALALPAEVAPGFELVDVLGYGALGVVYRARQATLDRDVALKTIQLRRMEQPGILARFQREAKALASLRHPNIVAAYDTGSYQGRLWFAMELVEGEDLDTRLQRCRQLAEPVVWAIVRQVASGLAHAWEAGVVHRDIKPANLLLAEPPAGFSLPRGVPLVKITDFGLAMLRVPTEDEGRLTVAGTSLGTPQYMAPEQLRDTTVDQRADIYSLGATAYHMLSGLLPFHAKTTGEVLTLKLLGRAQPLAEVSPGISPASRDLVASMMAHDPAERIGSYHVLFELIDRLVLPAGRALPINDPLAHTLVGESSFAAVAERVGTTPESDRLAGNAISADPLSSDLRDRKTTWLRRHSGQRVIPLLGVLVLGVLAAWWFWPHGQAVVSGQRFKLTGWQQPLYDGQSLTGWAVGPGSEWKKSHDGEGGVVLAGSGSITRTLPQPVGARENRPFNYRVQFGVDLHEAAAVEAHFGMSNPPGRNALRHVLRLTRQAVLLGDRQGEQGDFVAREPGISKPEVNRNGDGPDYQSVRIERHGNFWLVYVNERRVGSLSTIDSSGGAVLGLYVEGGLAHFEDLHIAELGIDGSTADSTKPADG